METNKSEISLEKLVTDLESVELSILLLSEYLGISAPYEKEHAALNLFADKLKQIRRDINIIGNF